MATALQCSLSNSACGPGMGPWDCMQLQYMGVGAGGMGLWGAHESQLCAFFQNCNDLGRCSCNVGFMGDACQTDGML